MFFHPLGEAGEMKLVFALGYGHIGIADVFATHAALDSHDFL